MRNLRILPALLLFPFLTQANALMEADQQSFINRFADISVEEMGRTGIPASIKLAQAIIESGWGKGTIATKANNFFCIKCYNGWDGPTFKEWDDETEKSCFRKYDNVVQSFIDHSDFLTRNARYSSLFELPQSDYKAWAYGLKKCGYATNKQYAEKLISIIEGYGLWIYDFAVPMSGIKVIENEEIEPEQGELKEEVDFIIEPMTWRPVIRNEAPPVSAPEVMEVPGYRKETLPPNQEILIEPLPVKYQAPKSPKRKIRPIMPLPNLDMERR